MSLSHEQELFLIALRQKLPELSREQLAEGLCDCWEQRFALKNQMLELAAAAGICLGFQPAAIQSPPEDEDEFEEIFGFTPTEAEAELYLEQLEIAATMEIDMDEAISGELEPDGFIPPSHR